MSANNIGSFFLELGAEELPAGQVDSISNHIKEALAKSLEDAEISFKEIEILYTPRRLFFAINDLALDAQDKELVIKGPPEKIAKSDDGGFTQAALGFAKKNELAETDLYFEEGYLQAKKSIQGRTAKKVLEEKIPEIIASTPGVRFMRWGDGELKFARPLQWIAAFTVAGSNKEVLEMEIEGLKAGLQSYGHRFLGPDAFEFDSKDTYISNLGKQGVFVDPDKRREKVMEDAMSLARTVKARPVFDDDLLDEIVLITENPTPILCEFSKHFLAIPPCVLKTVMIAHQRYIPLESNTIDDQGSGHKLVPHFIAVSNNPLEKARENIKSGNEKVIVPRFKDAEFFVEEDSKISLKERMDKLEKLNSLKGTMRQKVKRLEQISEFILDSISKSYPENPHKGAHDTLNDKIIDEIKQAALLSKSDLSSNLVFEFTELQGEIGGVYAEKEGYSEVISSAISEHYMPRFAGDDEPGTIGAKVISIADKLDNIVSAFALGKIPSGSADPFALRRQANGLLEIIIHGHIILDVNALVDFIVKLQRDEFGDGEMIKKMKGRGKQREEVTVPELEWEGCDEKVKDFLVSRLPFVFEIYHKDAAVNKAVLANGNPLKDLQKRHMMIHLLYSMKVESDFEPLVEAASRVINITKGEEADLNGNKPKVDTGLFEGEHEKKFFEAISPLDKVADQNDTYKELLTAKEVLSLVQPINSFFDNVLVNAEDAKIKANRKALVSYASAVFNEIGDFSLLSS